jgi:hypothetical protein
MSPISGAATENWNSGTNQQSPGGWTNDFAFRNYQSRLPELYTGHPNRIERYNQYEMMDVDPEINACLDILSEFSTQQNEHNNTPFSIEFNEEPTSTEVDLITKQLHQWCKLNEFNTRMFKIFRNTIKYGDQVFVRDPENFKLYWVDMAKVAKVIVNESAGKEPEQYVIKDINPNLQNLSVAEKTTTDFQAQPPTAGHSAPYSYTVPNEPYGTSGSRFSLGINECAVDAKHIVHVSLTEGLDRFWPFGQSILENIFKVYKQKELLEDAILIYRVQRAPERRIFKIDVGNMPSHLAMAFVNRIKDEIHQRRIPSTHGGSTVLDATYNPLSINEDYFFPVTADGRGSDVTTLPGGCFSMDTKVSLLDGRELSIAEIESEMKTGKQLWTYSCEPLTGKVVPGLITWAGVTKPRAKVLKITLDNGEHIICTPEHKFPVYEQEFKRADEFVVGDSMIPLYRKKEYLGKSKNEYEQYYDNEAKEWKFTHRTVADYLKDTLVCYRVHDSSTSNGLYEVRHHRDFNRFNNDPQNLCWMSFRDHIKYHADHNTQRIQIIKENNINEYRKICKNNSIAQKRRWENTTPDQKEHYAESGRQFWSNLTDEEHQLITDKMSASIKKYIESLSEDDRESRAQNSRDAFKIASERKLEKMRTDEEYHAWVCQQQSAGWTEKLREHRAYQTREWNYINWSGERGKERKKKHSDSQRVEYTHDMLKFVIDMVKGKTTHEVTADTIAAELNKSSLRDKLVELNKDKQVRNWKVEEGFTPGNIRRSLVQQFGYKSWKDFRVKESVHNHRVAAIEWLEEEIPVGTLTIDGDEIYHDYHTFALSVGVFTKNSNLGEIDDLKYFNNRLARGLRVPSSYLPTGPEDSERPLVDGKVGTALIQEHRFNQYCMRLQGYMAEKLNNEFKLFMRWRGFNIDSGLFDLKFNPPQNFASYRQSEIDQVRVNVFSAVSQLPYMSTRFAMKRFLGLTQEEIKENETLWHEERTEPESEDDTAKGTDLRNIGLSTSDIEGDIETAETLDQDQSEQAGGLPPETTAPVGGPPTTGPETQPPPM